MKLVYSVWKNWRNMSQHWPRFVCKSFHFWSLTVHVIWIEQCILKHFTCIHMYTHSWFIHYLQEHVFYFMYLLSRFHKSEMYSCLLHTIQLCQIPNTILVKGLLLKLLFFFLCCCPVTLVCDKDSNYQTFLFSYTTAGFINLATKGLKHCISPSG